MADLGHLLSAAKAAKAISPAPSYPWESVLLYVLGIAGAVVGTAVPGIAPQVRDVLTAISGLLVAVTASQRHATARKG
jgi:hypothetical protein